jgi:Flp pilus assembly protein TadG
MKDGKKTQRGSSAVEFALVLPLLLFVVFAIVDFGWLFFTDAQVTNAARQGARTGAAQDPGLVESKAKDSAEQALTASHLDVGKANVDAKCDDSAGPASAFVTVDITYTYEPLIGAALPFLGNVLDVAFKNVKAHAEFHLDNGQGCS